MPEGNPNPFQSLTRDSNHSNSPHISCRGVAYSFNPSRGIAIIQTGKAKTCQGLFLCFNPSRGIAIIQTAWAAIRQPRLSRFNPSRGIAIIQTDRPHDNQELMRVSIPHAG